MLDFAINGLLGLSIWQLVIVTLVLTQITIAAVTLYLHRCQSHKAISLHPVVSHFFRFWLWLTTGMNTKEWVAIHRKHHVKCETSDDPHSPVILGLNKVLWEGTELYRDESRNQETMKRYGAGTPNDWIERNIYSRWKTLGIAIMLIINLVLFGIAGLTMWAVQMMWIPFFAAGVVNGIGHYWGYRNFECPDAARNIIPWGLFIGGEELHNNHHTFANSAKLSAKWYEIDLGWWYICLLNKLNLAKIHHVPPQLATQHSKHNIDFDTVRAVVANRFQVLANYRKKVIVPVLQQEREQHAAQKPRLLQRAKKLLYRDPRLLRQQAKERLDAIRTQYQSLDTVYEYRLRLQAIWEQKYTSSKELLERLQEWCQQAEASGIKALQDFVEQLRAYVPKETTA